MYLITVLHTLRYITRHRLPVFNLKQVNEWRQSPPFHSHSHYSRDKVRVRKVGPHTRQSVEHSERHIFTQDPQSSGLKYNIL